MFESDDKGKEMISSFSHLFKSQFQAREPRADVRYKRLRSQKRRDLFQADVSCADRALAKNLELSMRHDGQAGPSWRKYFEGFSDERERVAALGKGLYEPQEGAGPKPIGPLIRVILETQDLPSIQAVHDWAPEGFYDGNQIYCTKQMIFKNKGIGSSEHTLYFKNLDCNDKDHVPRQEWVKAARSSANCKGTRVIFEPLPAVAPK